ncbi:alkaline phosphatase [Algimonas arctica]|uniref:Alkaline phosphatase n=1 Tax=Algimonas arctica TaxID=1479486 RepID=A0A8J3G2L1_9PROT|nr:alkaline phosphatase [Algimonas arctica]
MSLPDDVKGSVPVRYEISTDPKFTAITASGTVDTDASRDWTVKATVNTLMPGLYYHYRFFVGEMMSPIGQSRTLPTGKTNAVRFAVVSCSNYAFGFFNVYDAISKRNDIDAVIHLGDYIYEYGTDGYGGAVSQQIGRQHDPITEIITLADYRKRHAQYKSDPGSIAMHAAHAMIPIWDDHETSNDSWRDGAENHSLSEGDWDERRSAALRAYYEWMPVRDPVAGDAAEALLRDFQWGDLVTIATVETRLMARSQPLNYTKIGGSLATPEGLEKFKTIDLVDEGRELLGRPQLERLTKTMADSVANGTRWRILANQIIMANVTAPNLTPLASSPAITEIEKVFPQIRDFIALTTLGIPLNLDAWDGYPAARDRFYASMADAGATDLIVLTGDTHEWWANELSDSAGRPMGVELGTAAVTSPGSSSYFGEEAANYSQMLNARNPMVRYHDPSGKGYIDLALDRDGAHAEFVGVDTILSTDYTVDNRAGFDIVRRDGSLSLTKT